MALHDDLPLPPARWQEIAEALRLAPRQKEVVELRLRNGRCKDIARHLECKHPTIRSHFKVIFRRAGVADWDELVLLILRMSHDMNHRTR